MFEEEGSSWGLQDCRRSIPQSSQRHEEPLPQLPMEHLPHRVVHEVVQHQGGAGQRYVLRLGYVPEKRVSWTDRPEYTG